MRAQTSSHRFWTLEALMEITTLIAAVAALGLPCTDPELRDFPVQQMRCPAAYIPPSRATTLSGVRQLTPGMHHERSGTRASVAPESCHRKRGEYAHRAARAISAGVRPGGEPAS